MTGYREFDKIKAIIEIVNNGYFGGSPSYNPYTAHLPKFLISRDYTRKLRNIFKTNNLGELNELVANVIMEYPNVLSLYGITCALTESKYNHQTRLVSSILYNNTSIVWNGYDQTIKIA